MRKSFSKIRHIQESNMILEQRKLNKLLYEANYERDPKRITFFNLLAQRISEKLLNKKMYFGKIGVLDNTTIIIQKYNDRNHSIDLKGEKIKELNLFFNVRRVEEDLYNYEKSGDRIWKGLLEISAKFDENKTMTGPFVNLYPLDSKGEANFNLGMTPERPFTWDQVGGQGLWNQAQLAPNS